MDLTLDMGLVLTTPPPRHSESAMPDTPTHDLLHSSPTTPPPKKNKVGPPLCSVQAQPDPPGSGSGLLEEFLLTNR